MQALSASCRPCSRLMPRRLGSNGPLGPRKERCRALHRRIHRFVAFAEAPKGRGVVQREILRFFQKYDVASAGLGALTVTSFCVAKGQDPWTALSITLAATVAALVINEYVFDSDSL